MTCPGQAYSLIAGGLFRGGREVPDRASRIRGAIEDGSLRHGGSAIPIAAEPPGR
jgi:hypothetical protein